MKLLTKEVGLISEEDIGTLNLAKIEAKSSDLVRRDCQWVDVRSDVIPEGHSGVDDRTKGVLLLRLEWEVCHLFKPIDELFKLRSCGISRNL